MDFNIYTFTKREYNLLKRVNIYKKYIGEEERYVFEDKNDFDSYIKENYDKALTLNKTSRANKLGNKINVNKSKV